MRSNNKNMIIINIKWWSKRWSFDDVHCVLNLKVTTQLSRRTLVTLRHRASLACQSQYLFTNFESSPFHSHEYLSFSFCFWNTSKLYVRVYRSQCLTFFFLFLSAFRDWYFSFFFSSRLNAIYMYDERHTPQPATMTYQITHGAFSITFRWPHDCGHRREWLHFSSKNFISWSTSHFDLAKFYRNREMKGKKAAKSECRLVKQWWRTWSCGRFWFRAVEAVCVRWSGKTRHRHHSACHRATFRNFVIEAL